MNRVQKGIQREEEIRICIPTVKERDLSISARLLICHMNKVWKINGFERNHANCELEIMFGKGGCTHKKKETSENEQTSSAQKQPALYLNLTPLSAIHHPSY